MSLSISVKPKKFRVTRVAGTCQLVRNSSYRNPSYFFPSVPSCIHSHSRLCASDDEGASGIEAGTLVLCLSIFLVSCPADVTASGDLLEQCARAFAEACDSNKPRVCPKTSLQLQIIQDRLSYILVVVQVQLTCVQACISIFQHAQVTVATPLIHSVTPRVIKLLLPCDDDVTSETDIESTRGRVESEADVTLWMEGVRLLETLVALTSDDKRKCNCT